MSRIPAHAQKVFEGIIFDVYHWQQEQFDGTFKTFEALKHHDSVVVIPVVGDMIYIQKEEQPGDDAPEFSLPAGRFEKGETDPMQVGARELLEETGYHSDEFVFLRTHARDEGKIEWSCHIIIARNCKKVAEPNLDAGEKIHETKLLSFDDFLAFTDRPDFFSGVLADDWQKAKTDPVFREEFRKTIFGV